MHSSPWIHHRSVRIVAHATSSGLMLSAAQIETGWLTPHLQRTRSLQPFACAFEYECRCAYSFGMGCAGETRHWNPPAITHRVIKSHTRLGTWDFLHGTCHTHDAGVVLTHKVFVCQAPTRQVWW